MEPVRVLELRSVCGTGGGPEKTVLLGAARADRARVQVTVCYLRNQDDAEFKVGERAAALGVDYVEVRERHSLDPRIWTQLRDLVRRRRIHIVHGHEYKTNLLALLLAKVEGVIPLTTVHGWTGHSAMERYIYYPADKLLIRGFPIAVAVSGEIRTELLRRGCDPARVTVVLNGIDHRKFKRNAGCRDAARSSMHLSPNDIVIGSVGRLEPQKRFDLLIEAFWQLRRTHQNIHLLIAGEGSARATLGAQIASRGLTDRVRLLGHRADIVDLHHAFDLFVQSSEYEGTPNVVLEAMALETPVIATDVGGTAELVRNGQDGIIVPPKSAEHLCLAIREALDHPAATQARCTSARRRVENELSFEARMDTVERIYERLAEGYRQ